MIGHFSEGVLAVRFTGLDAERVLELVDSSRASGSPETVLRALDLAAECHKEATVILEAKIAREGR